MISTGRLNTLRCLHHRPIEVLFSDHPYSLDGMGGLFLGRASRLDAFSAYRLRTWLPSICPWQDSWITRGPLTPVLSYWG